MYLFFFKTNGDPRDQPLLTHAVPPRRAADLRSTKLLQPTNCDDRPKASSRRNDCHMGWPAGRKKKTTVISSWGASSRYGNVLWLNTTRFSMFCFYVCNR